MQDSLPILPHTKTPAISVVIAARNAEAFLAPVLRAFRASSLASAELVLVDDCSSDNTARRAAEAGARVIRLERPAGAAMARNRGAQAARAPIVFFTDHDCCLLPHTLERIVSYFKTAEPSSVLGGTYTIDPYDPEHFASCFQSLHVHYSETRKREPDYIASHCLAMNRAAFLREGGFPEDFSLILANGCCQDVLFCQLLKRRGYRLVVDPDLQVRHIFNFTLRKSLSNAFWKSRAWTRVARGTKSLMEDSGSASTEMKVAGFLVGASILALLLALPFPQSAVAFPALALGSLLANARIYSFIARHRGLWFAFRSMALYSLQLAVILAGAFVGLLQNPIKGSRSE